MILNRLSRAIAKQNWGTVVLEILVVVVGIFLGLRVDDWNESRKNRQLESVYLDKLYADVSTMRQELDRNRARAQEARQRMIAAVLALESCTTDDQAKSDLKFTLERYQVQGPISYLGATYDEMVESGALARIEDHQLKQQIAYSYSQLADHNTNQRAMRVSMPVVDRIVWEAVAYTVTPGNGAPVVSFDMPALCDNTEFRNALVEMIDLQWDTETGARRGLESVDELLTSLEKHRDRSPGKALPAE